MTTEEAFETLKRVDRFWITKKEADALDIAIKALQQVGEIKEALDAYNDCEVCQGFRGFSTNDLVGCVRRIVKWEIPN